MNSYCADSVLLKGVICGALPCIFKIKTKCFSTFFLLRFQSPVCAYGLLGMSSCKNNIFSYKDKGHISDLKEKELLNPSLLNKPNILEWTLTHIYMRKKSSTSRFLLKMCSVMVAWAEPALFHALRPGLSNHARNASSLLLYEL